MPLEPPDSVLHVRTAAETAPGRRAPAPAFPDASTRPADGRALAGLLRPEMYAARLKRRVDALIHARRVAAHERDLARDPANVALWVALAGLHETGGDRERVSRCYHSLAAIHRSRGEVDKVAFCYRRLEHLGLMDAAALHRHLGTLFAEARRYEDALRACRRVVEIYVAEGNRSAALGYMRMLPSLGPSAAAARAGLEGLLELPVGGATGENTRTAEVASAGSSRSGERINLLRGTLGETTVLDLLQAAEDDAVTGQLELRRDAHVGLVYFSAGRIVASRLGRLTRREALRGVLKIETGAYRLKTTDLAAFDEFRSPNNSSLLAGLLRRLD